MYVNGKFPEKFNQEKTEQQIAKFQDELLNFTSSFQNNDKKMFAGVAFISFRTEKMKRILLSKYKLNKFKRFIAAFKDVFFLEKAQKSALFFHKTRLVIEEAPEPGDIYWNHLGLSDSERYIRRFIGYSIFFILLISCSLVIYYFTVKQQDLSNSESDTSFKIKVITVGLSIVIVVINKALSFIMPLIVKYNNSLI